MKNVYSEQEKVQLLADIVEMNTVNGNEIEVANYLKDLFEKHGITAEIDEIEGQRVNLVASIGEGHPVVGISGHMDVVSEGDPSDWTYPPFELTEKRWHVIRSWNVRYESRINGLSDYND